MNRWLPIASAPRHGHVTICEAGRPDSVRTCEWWPSRQRWVLASGAAEEDLIYFRGHPTHWLRTPEVPPSSAIPLEDRIASVRPFA